jgi:hypothetical protein
MAGVAGRSTESLDITMYSQGASFTFGEAVPQAERFAALAEIATQIDALPGLSTGNPGYSLSVDARGSAELVVWHPTRWWPAQLALRKFERRGILRVTRPNDFAASVDAAEKERATW